jgi:hypothetical protein
MFSMYFERDVVLLLCVSIQPSDKVVGQRVLNNQAWVTGMNIKIILLWSVNNNMVGVWKF